MAILDHFRFGAARRPSFVTSDAASGSSGQSSKSNRSANVLKLAKSFSWKTDSSSNSDSSNDDGGLCNTVDRPEKGVPSWLKKKNKKKDAKKMHPSEKPLTMVNIQHQEMLSHFTWTFGNRRDSYDERLEVEGISPGTSRMPSMDGGRPSAADLAQGGQQQSSSSSDADGRERVPHGELFHSGFLSPDSAATAFGPRRSAMRGAE